MQAKNGYLAAIVATANKLAKIIFTLVKTKSEFDDTFAKITEEEILKKKLCNAQRNLQKIQNQLLKVS